MADEVQTLSAGECANEALKFLDGKTPLWPTTGFRDLDEVIGGLPLGQFTTVAGSTGMGKTCFASSSMVRTAKQGHHVLMFSLEMTAAQLGARMLADLAYTQPIIQYEDIVPLKRINETQRRRLAAAQRELDGLPIRIVEKPSIGIEEIVGTADKHATALVQQNKKLSVIFVDHISIMRPPRCENRNRELAIITSELAALGKHLNCAVIGLCQLNRDVSKRDNKRPTMTDLRESGAIEENSSLVMFVYRPAFYLSRARYDDREQEQKRRAALDHYQNKLEVSVAKNRNGRIGTIDMFCDIGANAVRDSSFVRGR
jgi:replicative DNA helicase